MTQTALITQRPASSLITPNGVQEAGGATRSVPLVPLTPEQLMQQAGSQDPNPAAVATHPPSPLGDPAKPLLPGRLLEQLLLNPQTVPQSELKLLRQELQQRLATAVLPSEQFPRYLVVASLLKGADGLPLINPQLRQQLEGKQISAPTAHTSQQPSVTVQQTPSEDRQPRSVKTSAEQLPAAGLPTMLPTLLPDDASELQQLALRLVIEETQVTPERQQLLLLAALLLDEQEASLSNLGPRARRRLSQQLVLAIQHRLGWQSLQETASQGVPATQQVATRSAVSHSLLRQLPVGERWSDTEEETDSLPVELLWPGLAMAPATVKPAQLEAALGNLLDKHSLGVTERNGVQQLVSRASMDQLLMIVSTVMISINGQMAQSILDAQKINKEASDQMLQNQLQKQIEEAEKALQDQENAKKAGIFGQIFSWITSIASVVIAVVTLNPVAIVGAIMQVVGTAMETAVFALGEKAPPWLQKLGMGLQIGGALLTVGVSLLKSAGTAISKAVTTVGSQGLKAALQQGFQAILGAITQAYKNLLQNGFKSALSKLKEAGESLGRGVQQGGKKAVAIVKNPKQAAEQLWTNTRQTVEGVGSELAGSKNLKVKVGVVKKGAEGISATARAAEQLTQSVYELKHGQLQEEIKRLQNDSWLLDMILEHYQKQRKQMHHLVTDLYQRQGDTLQMVSEQLKESAGVHNRIASRLA